MKSATRLVVASMCTVVAAGCLNPHSVKVYRVRLVDHDSGEGVLADPQVRLLTNIEYFTVPSSHEPPRMLGSVGEFELRVRWVALAVHVFRAPYPQKDWAYLPARVTFDRRVKPGIVVESPRRSEDDPGAEPRYRRTYPIDEKGVIVVPLFRKPAGEAGGGATQPMTGEVVPAGGDR